MFDYDAPTVIQHAPQRGTKDQAATVTEGRWYRIPASENSKQATANSTSRVLEFPHVAAPEVVALGRLRRFKTFHANWDAEGAPAPDAQAIDMASQVLSLLVAKGFTPKALLNADSAPVLLFRVKGVECEVTVNRKDSIDYFLNTADGAGDADVHFDGKSLPIGLVSMLQA